MKKAGNACELIGFEGQGHGFFNHGRGDNSNYESTIRELDRFLVSHGFLEPQRTPKSPQLTTIDLSDDTDRQVIVDREPGQYLGHPTTCLLEDGKTMLCVYPKGHGRGGIVYKRSDDGGLTWSDRLPTPENWSTSREVPTLHRVIGPDGSKRIIMWSGLYPARLAVSENDGLDWSPLKPVGDWGGIVVMGFVEALETGPGHYLAMFHDDGRFFTADGKRSKNFTLYKTLSTDGGLTWSAPESVYQSSDVHLCEPGCIRSPDGKRLAVLLRENARRKNSHIIFSDDEGQTWSSPRELPLALTGDRHTGKYTADGRLFISYRCQSPVQSRKDRPFEGDWVGWVGTWDDLVSGRDGQYFVRLGDNTKGADTAYPGVEVLPDDTIVTTTYGHWTKGEQPYIMSVRLKLSELDQK
ncbi:MAG: exo-alpha-sialidase [Phycisphaera sp. RhM]|nr:exo-alpha-sialidase [Phycisphaera sp. RhM]